MLQMRQQEGQLARAAAAQHRASEKQQAKDKAAGERSRGRVCH
jgi:hypothetical protein